MTTQPPVVDEYYISAPFMKVWHLHRVRVGIVDRSDGPALCGVTIAKYAIFRARLVGRFDTVVGCPDCLRLRADEDAGTEAAAAAQQGRE